MSRMITDCSKDERGGQNRLLVQLSVYQQSLVSKSEMVLRTRGTVLHEQGSVVPYLYFPQSTAVLLLIIPEDGSSVEVATVGREGVIRSIEVRTCTA